MRPRRRRADPMDFPLASNRLVPQPIGVVGVISPWNFPLQLSFNPLVSIFAAGNPAMVKMSEFSRGLAELLIRTAPKYFPAEKLNFSMTRIARPRIFGVAVRPPHLHRFDRTGRAVMTSAARNLTPVTLELGGKSPAVVAPEFPLKTAAERILWAKMFNAGQVCVNVDYCFVPEGKRGGVRGAGEKACRRALSRSQRRPTTPRSSTIAITRGSNRWLTMRSPRARRSSISPQARGPIARRVSFRRKFARRRRLKWR